MNQKHSDPSHIIKGSLFAIFAFFSMAVFGVLTQQAYKTADPIWVSFITYAIATLGVACLILPRGIDTLKSQHYGYLIARAVIGTCASFLYMISMLYIPIVNATLLFNTAPIFIPLISVCWLKMHIKKNIWYAVILGFIGIVIIIHPGADILTNPGNLIGLLSGLALAIAYLLTKILTSTDLGLRIIFYYFSIGVLIQIPLLFLTRGMPTIEACIYSTLSGLALICAQIGLVKAYTYANASEVGVYQYTSIVFVALIEWLIWAKTPSLMDVLGFILVTIAGVIIIHAGIKPKIKLK